MSTRRRFCVFLMAMLISCWASLAFAEKTDIVELINGNMVTGEVKSLVFGELKYSTDSMGTVKIDWEDVVSLTSSQYVEVEVTTGSRYYGNLEMSDPKAISVGFGEDITLLSMSEVVRITPIDTAERLINRLEGSIDFGFNSNNAVTQSNLSANIRYRTEKFLLGTTLNSTITDQDEGNTQRINIGFNYQRFMKNRWFTDWFVSGEQNDELNIDLRSSLGGGIGRYMIQTSTNELSALIGLVATRESFTGQESSTTNAEGKISFLYRHRNLSPDSGIEFTTDIFPLIEDLSSFRAETNLIFHREFIDDLLFKISIYHSYLSDPTEGAEKSDYGVVTSLGFSF